MSTLEAEMEAAPEALINRKIDFHSGSKSFNGFSNTKSNSGFKLVSLNPKAPESHTASGSTKKSERSELLESGLDAELSFRITFRRIGAGLRNLGNTCFLNSVLQCLTYTEPLAAYLQSGKHQSSCRTAGFCALCAIQKHVSRALQSTGRILEPKDLVSNLRCISRSFRNARQEDAHEYMVNLLESMHKCCLPSGVPSESASAYEKSLVHKIFGGRLRSQVKCMQCSFCSNKFDPFLDLSLEIVKAESLCKALAHFTAKEQLDGGAKQYQCQQCNQKVRALKQLTIYQAPHVLAIHLKRFDSHLRGQKITKNVSFGPTLDLKPFVTGSYDVPLRYTLYGVLVHAGWSTHSGHYYCFIRTSTGMWFCLDDNQVVQVSEKIVLGQKAYMLFYVRDVNSVGGVKKNVDSKPKAEARQKNLSSEKICEGSFSAALSEKDAPEKPPKPILSQHITGIGAVAHNIPKTDPKLEPSLIVVPPKDSVGICTIVTTNSIVHKVDSSKVESGDSLNSSHIGNVVTCNNRFSILQDIDSDMKDSDVKESSQNNDSANRSANESLNQTTSDVGNLNGTHAELREEESNKIVCTQPSEKTSSEKSQDSCCSKTGDAPVEVSLDAPATRERVSRRKKALLKVNTKKLFKYQIARQLSSTIIFGAALCPRKKNNKQRKSHSRKQSLVDKDVSSHVGSSKSLGHPKAQKKSSDKGTVPNTVQPSDATIGEFRKRVRPNDTILPNKTKSNSLVQETVTSEDNSKSLKPKDIMSILTRGLEATTVDRWNGSGVSFLEKEVINAQIGYIGDEWDEEYDRGSRKKIKQKEIKFGGPNLFQEIALGKSNAKRKNTVLKKPAAKKGDFRHNCWKPTIFM